ncbi:AAA family ATPase [Coraliomargarita sp. SDUM461004]|uniref:AAA family ATPase n=1 Tax=Thalassobacterium sedimentorum TaxID=3041258 RepID=A0ABU1ANU4_9BACT|nr:AAA family ATPase [Coraliomargarita sp. SDUM461004]MDQ8195873.1 AAA family ATPase [Coraliomargarita sp. SDUM461004]
MSYLYARGLVVGKFSPLHLGHESLIRAALERCERVYLISYSNPEFSGCERAHRERWLKLRFPNVHSIVIDAENVSCMLGSVGWDYLPSNEAAAEVHRKLCADICLQIFKTSVDVVFSSEDYGAGFARYLSGAFSVYYCAPVEVESVCLDPSRRRLPISGSQIRANPHQHRAYLSSEVYCDFVEKVCFLGGESTGKSTLSRLAAERFGTEYVAEYGRTLWEAQSGLLLYSDMLKIAQVQIEQEQQASMSANRYLFCDTSPLTTLLYSDEMFGEVDDALEVLANRQYEHIFLCEPDFDFVQDGTRKDDSFRRYQHDWYIRELNKRGHHYIQLKGSIAERLKVIESVLS